MGKLTVLITTYNRKEPLINQLKSLEIQGHFREYRIIISDNHSDYNVEECVRSQFSSDFLSMITIVSRPYNVGSDLNITLGFQLPETEWVWLLSDDDLTQPDSLSIVLSDIDNYSDTRVDWIKYSIAGNFAKNEERIIESVENLFDYYSRGKVGAGQFYFMANNVFRVGSLRPYFSDSCIYSDNAMPHVFLPLYAIKFNNSKVAMSPKCLTNYTQGRATYTSIWAVLRFSNILFSSLYLDSKEIKAFKRVEFFGIISVIDSMANVNDRSLRWEYFKKIFTGHYRLLSLKGMAFITLYISLSVLGSKQWKRIRKKKF